MGNRMVLYHGFTFPCFRMMVMDRRARMRLSSYGDRAENGATVTGRLRT